MIDILLKATILLVLVAVAAWLLRRRSAELRHLVWTLAIAGLIALPLLTAVVPFSLPVLPTPRVLSPAVDDQRDFSSPPPTTQPQRADADSPAPVLLASEETASERATATPRAAFDLGRALIAAWLLGAVALLARFVVGILIVHGIARRATPVSDDSDRSMRRALTQLGITSSVQLRRSDEVAMPFACGLFAPVIVLPSSSTEWSTERRDAVLMHEVAHISRGDLAMNTLSHVVRALYWFHPLAWLAAYRLRVEGERACDDAVLRAGTLPSNYAEHLLNIVRSVGNTVPAAALAMARRTDFEGRLLAILEPGVVRVKLTRWRAVGVAALFLGFVMPLAAMTPASATSSTSTLRQVAQPGSPPAQTAEQATAVAALMETLTDANPAVRLAAVGSLGSLGDPRAIAALAKALREDSDARVREAAARALGEIDDNRAVPALIEALRSERTSNVREEIVRALGEIDDPSAVAGISAVAKDPSPAVRRAAVWALGELEDASAVTVLITMVRDEDVEVRRHIAEALGQLENPAAMDALITLARDADADVRSQAVDALSNFEDQRTLPTFLAALKDPNKDVRHHAAHGIGNIDNLKTAPRPLIEALADSDREVRQSVAQALGDIGDEAAVPALKRAITDSDVDVRRQAAEALSDIGGVEAIQALMGLLKDPDPEIRKTAAEALGKRRD
jgi:HEAT repeat protein/beta-lactamase regulating signal transducer with metallopeptidase domain